MRIKLLIATVDIEYAALLSDNISKNHTGTIEVSICSALEGIKEMLSNRKYNVALIDMEMIQHIDSNGVHMPMLLWSEDFDNENFDDLPKDMERIKKHQRVSSIVATIFEKYAKVSGSRAGLDMKQARITAVWSPAGGVGKTTIALAYALSNAAEGKDVFYLNLENFSSLPGCFSENGKSISRVFEVLETPEVNLRMLIQGISCVDGGITYLCGPENYDDMCILSSDNIHELIETCSQVADELVIDLSCVYDLRTKKALEIADKILIVMDGAAVVEAKLNQFMSQNNVFEGIKEKISFISNKGAEVLEPFEDSAISLPLVHSSDMITVYKTLSEDWRRELV